MPQSPMRQPPMRQPAMRQPGEAPLRAGAAYFGWIFALGFVLGTVRTLWLTPRLGPLLANAVELPVMLGASAALAPRLLRRHGIARPAPALAMGLCAFVLLLAAELALAVLLFGQGPAQWLRALGTAPGLLGLAGQAVFALLPRALVRRAG